MILKHRYALLKPLAESKFARMLAYLCREEIDRAMTAIFWQFIHPIPDDHSISEH